MAFKDMIKRLHEDPLFQRFIKEVLIPGAPKVMPFNPSSDNTDQWKYHSGVREGYRLALSEIGVKIDG